MHHAANSQTVSERLLRSGKRLFAAHGFEGTTTSGIAREAGTSESQLVKYFGSKEGLLLKIFEEGWLKMSFMYTAASVATSPVESLRVIFELLVKSLTEDRELRDLMLFEGRRIRGKSSEILVTSGYYRLYEEVARIMERMAADNGARAVSPKTAASAFIGMLESMLRDQAIAERKTGRPDPTSDEIRTVFQLFSAFLLDAAPGKLPRTSLRQRAT